MVNETTVSWKVEPDDDGVRLENEGDGVGQGRIVWTSVEG